MLFFEPHQLAPEATRQWRLGALTLRARQRSSGLLVQTHYGDDPLAEDWEDEGSGPAPATKADQEVLLAGISPNQAFSLRPRLADRPLVARPDFDVRVAPGAQLEVFLTSPLWIEICAQDAALVEFPTWHASSTWFGEDPTRGMLAYALRTRMRTSIEELSGSRARVATRALIRNDGVEPVHLSRAAVPLPSMQLYVDENERCWTDSVTIRCKEGKSASVSVMAPDDPISGRFEKISARTPPPPDGLIEAFSSILSNPFSHAG